MSEFILIGIEIGNVDLLEFELFILELEFFIEFLELELIMLNMTFNN